MDSSYGEVFHWWLLVPAVGVCFVCCLRWLLSGLYVDRIGLTIECVLRAVGGIVLIWSFDETVALRHWSLSIFN